MLSNEKGLFNNDNNNNNNNNNMLQRVGKCIKYFRCLSAVQMSVLVYFAFLFLGALSGLNCDVDVL